MHGKVITVEGDWDFVGRFWVLRVTQHGRTVSLGRKYRNRGAAARAARKLTADATKS